MKNPKSRISVLDAKRHPFFKGLDWNKLYRKEILPPVMLRMEEEEESEEMQYLKQ
jgi:hypothetical protein